MLDDVECWMLNVECWMLTVGLILTVGLLDCWTVGLLTVDC